MTRKPPRSRKLICEDCSTSPALLWTDPAGGIVALCLDCREVRETTPTRSNR